MPTRPGDPRNTVAYRKAKAEMRAQGDTRCWLCGHPGAITADHIISVADWPKGMPGVNDPSNLRPAHGAANRCPTCDRACNESRGRGSVPTETHSRDW